MWTQLAEILLLNEISSSRHKGNGWEDSKAQKHAKRTIEQCTHQFISVLVWLEFRWRKDREGTIWSRCQILAYKEKYTKTNLGQLKMIVQLLSRAFGNLCSTNVPLYKPSCTRSSFGWIRMWWCTTWPRRRTNHTWLRWSVGRNLRTQLSHPVYGRSHNLFCVLQSLNTYSFLFEDRWQSMVCMTCTWCRYMLMRSSRGSEGNIG